jgi:peptidase YpeB-like protein
MKYKNGAGCAPLLATRDFCGLSRQGASNLAKFSETSFMKTNDFRPTFFLIIAFAVMISMPALAAEKVRIKHGQITKKQAEQIALAKIEGGKIRTAELQTANGAKFWSVYVIKPGSKNAKEVRVDAATGKIFNVQTEKPEDQAEEPAKTH